MCSGVTRSKLEGTAVRQVFVVQTSLRGRDGMCLYTSSEPPSEAFPWLVCGPLNRFSLFIISLSLPGCKTELARAVRCEFGRFKSALTGPRSSAMRFVCPRPKLAGASKRDYFASSSASFSIPVAPVEVCYRPCGHVFSRDAVGDICALIFFLLMQ